jgi:hypothetical protein
MSAEFRKKILNILKKMHPSDAIALTESIGKELRQLNSIRISAGIPVKYIDSDRPDLELIK